LAIDVLVAGHSTCRGGRRSIRVGSTRAGFAAASPSEA
jgi:hypothetical protein